MYVGSGLLWSRMCQGRSPYPSSRHRPSRGDIIAPSWSWVSFDRPIQFHTLYSSTSRESLNVTSYIDFHSEAPANNTYGEVRVGWIRMAAPLLSLITLDDQDPLGLGCDPWTRPWNSYAYEFAQPDIDVFVETCVDYPEDSASEILALPICCSNVRYPAGHLPVPPFQQTITDLSLGYGANGMGGLARLGRSPNP